MEFQGVKALGTVISYEPSLNLFKVRVICFIKKYLKWINCATCTMSLAM